MATVKNSQRNQPDSAIMAAYAESNCLNGLFWSPALPVSPVFGSGTLFEHHFRKLLLKQKNNNNDTRKIKQPPNKDF